MKRFAQPTLLLALALTFGLTACDEGERDVFISALPSAEDVKLNVPENEGQALALGERSEMYELTYDMSRGINGHIGAVFAIIDAIVQSEPTTSEENSRVWGPSDPQGLERLSYRFTVERVQEGVFEYVLDTRPKGSDAEEDFLAVWTGIAYPNADDDSLGSGELTLHFDNDDDDCSVGTAVVTYDAQSDRRAVDIAFDGIDNVCDDDDAIVQNYHYAEMPDGSGDFLFAVSGNIHDAEENKPGLETMTIKSRWLSSGAGRSDVLISGDEIEADLTEFLPDTGATFVEVTECWNDLFELTFTDTDPEELRGDIREQLGDESDCVIDSADYPESVEVL